MMLVLLLLLPTTTEFPIRSAIMANMAIVAPLLSNDDGGWSIILFLFKFCEGLIDYHCCFVVSYFDFVICVVTWF